MLAGRYTLLEQTALDELLPLCVERGVGVVAAGVFNSGLLAEAASPGCEVQLRRGAARARPAGREDRGCLRAARDDAALSGARVPLAHPAVVSVSWAPIPPGS